MLEVMVMMDDDGLPIAGLRHQIYRTVTGNQSTTTDIVYLLSQPARPIAFLGSTTCLI